MGGDGEGVVVGIHVYSEGYCNIPPSWCQAVG